MAGAHRKKQGTMLNGGRIAGDPPIGGARNARRIAAKAVSKGVDAALAAHPCGECSVCCTSMSVAEIGKEEGVPCSKLGPAGAGCTVYKTRPGSCVGYNCLFRVGLLDRHLPGTKGRPNELGIIFDVNETRATGIQLVVAREVVKGAVEANMALLHELAGKGFVLYLIEGERRRMMGPEEKVRAVQAAAKRALPLVMQ